MNPDPNPNRKPKRNNPNKIIGYNNLISYNVRIGWIQGRGAFAGNMIACFVFGSWIALLFSIFDRLISFNNILYFQKIYRILKICLFVIFLQVYKYREHIYYLQNKPFRPPSIHDSGGSNRPISASEACKLYGPNATQYINHSLTSTMNPVSPGAPTGDPKFSRNEKKAFSGGRQWQVCEEWHGTVRYGMV